MKKIVLLDTKILKSMLHKKKNEIILIGEVEEKENKIFVKNLNFINEGTEGYVLFDPELQLKFIKFCIEKDSIPIILHTHLHAKDKLFSDPDLSFLLRLYKCYKKMGGNNKMYAALINIQSKNVRYIYIYDGKIYAIKHITKLYKGEG